MNYFQQLTNPFVRYDSKLLLYLGIPAFFIGSILAYWFHARYDGAFDLHFSTGVNLSSAFTDNLIAVFSLGLIFLPAGKFLNKKTRWIDILTVILIARLPLYLITPVNIYDFTIHTTEQVLPLIVNEGPAQFQISKILGLAAIIMITLFFIIWMFILLFQGFKVATNGKGMKLTGVFVIAVFLAEIVSHLLFALITKI